MGKPGAVLQSGLDGGMCRNRILSSAKAVANPHSLDRSWEAFWTQLEKCLCQVKRRLKAPPRDSFKGLSHHLLMNQNAWILKTTWVFLLGEGYQNFLWPCLKDALAMLLLLIVCPKPSWKIQILQQKWKRFLNKVSWENTYFIVKETVSHWKEAQVGFASKCAVILWAMWISGRCCTYVQGFRYENKCLISLKR